MITAVIFDLDGTLFDSLGDIAESINLMLDDRGYPRCEPEDFKEMVGDGMEKLVERALPEHARTPELIAICVEEYRAHYDRHWNVQTTIYLGINELLASLRAQGFKLGVISNKAHRFTVPMTEHFFGMGTFDAVLGQRNEVPRKPAPDGAMEMATALGVPFASCAYVGDSGVDMKFGVNAGMRRIGVRWGFRSDEELLASGAEVLVSHPREILDFIQCC